MSGSWRYQPVEVQKALEYQLGWIILFLGENITENTVVLKNGFGMVKEYC